MAIKFEKAVKHGARGRLAICGPAGAGKTYTLLTIATEFVRLGLGKKIALACSEKGSAAKYADIFDFDIMVMDTFSPLTYVETIKAAEDAGYDIIILDGLSPAWTGKEGALEQVDMATRKSNSKSSFNAWRDVTPMHNEMIDAVVGSKAHIFASMRVKTEYAMETQNGKTVPVKIGLAPIQREGLDYEFDVVIDMNPAHEAVVGKTRCPKLDGKYWKKPGKELAEIFAEWLGGPAAPERKSEKQVEEERIRALIDDPEIKALFDELETAEAKRLQGATRYGKKEALLPILQKRVAEQREEKIKEAEKAKAALAKTEKNANGNSDAKATEAKAPEKADTATAAAPTETPSTTTEAAS